MYKFIDARMKSTDINYNAKTSFKMDAKYITVHNTANDASAENEIKYMINNKNNVSYHVAVDDKTVIQVLDYSRNAWHCGDGSGLQSGNRNSVGIEICYSKSGGERYKKAEENAVIYIADLLYRFGWDISRVKKHEDWSGKNCPHRILNEGRWESFLARIDARLKKLKSKVEVDEKLAEKNLLNETGRNACKSLIKRGVKSGLFTSKHTDVDKYSDVDLLSYALAFLERADK